MLSQSTLTVHNVDSIWKKWSQNITDELRGTRLELIWNKHPQIHIMMLDSQYHLFWSTNLQLLHCTTYQGGIKQFSLFTNFFFPSVTLVSHGSLPLKSNWYMSSKPQNQLKWRSCSSLHHNPLFLLPSNTVDSSAIPTIISTSTYNTTRTSIDLLWFITCKLTCCLMQGQLTELELNGFSKSKGVNKPKMRWKTSSLDINLY